MGKALVIVESPAKSKTITKFLGKGHTVKASMGHIIDLPKTRLGIDLAHDFKPEYVTIRGKSKILKELKAAAGKVDTVYLAPDPDREGEAIAWHIANYLKKFFKGNIYRIAFNEITKKAVQSAIVTPGQIDDAKVNAQQARRVLDRIVGYKLSPLLWKSLGQGLSAGRVQSVALRLICEREEEIKAFEVKEYWTIDALLIKKSAKVSTLEARLQKKGNDKLDIQNEAEAQAILSDLEGAEYVVASITKKQKKKRPYPPFKTSLLQQLAAHKLGFTASRTMSIAQQLYEGIDIGEEGTVGLITYMRTDSFRVSNDAISEVRDYIANHFGAAYLPKKPYMYAGKGKAQDAHEAIRPTSVLHTPDKLSPYLSKEQYKLYRLIWERFVASQMEAAQYDMTTVDIVAKDYLFRVTGSVITFQGYLSVTKEALSKGKKKKKAEDDDSIEGQDDMADKLLPALVEGEVLDLKKLCPEQHFTKPPARYSEATLVKALETHGIGRPSTYAPIIKTIEARDYARKIEKRFHPTEVGMKVVELLIKFFGNVMEIKFTAHMETILDKIESGDKEWTRVLHDFYTPFEKKVLAVDEQAKEIKKEAIKTDEICPSCGTFLVIKIGRFGQFLACNNYPDCKFTKERDDGQTEELPKEVLDEKCDQCGADMKVKKGRFGPFLACSKYPECKSTKPIIIKTGAPCPQEDCGGELLKRVSKKTRKPFYGCSNFPSCKYLTNTLPDRSSP